MNLLRRSPRSDPTRVFFAADIHGSDAAFRKFVNAASFYQADVLVFGGDLTGKATVPVVAQADGTHRAQLHGLQHTLDGMDAVRAFARTVETVGFYWELMDEDRYRSLAADPAAVEGLFVHLARKRLAGWIAFAQDRLAGAGVSMYLTGGNDDMPEVLGVLEDADGQIVIPCEHEVVDLDRMHTMVTIGYSTPTPWDTPREATEDQLADLIDASMSRVRDPARCVLNVHVPPLDSGLDRCLKVDATTDVPTVVKDAGRPVYYGGGSLAVREAVRRYQPLIGLHGHIHESPGQIRYGRTKCFNPGSEYARGVLSGLLLSIRDGELLGYQHTTG
ncbi:MAG TPA: metallophosphoesterase [Actinomycetota bacterium]|nr:metallophosphoesterase [Actinomycetota bacterium]